VSRLVRLHHSSVRGLVVMIVACQVMDPGSIPGERMFFARELRPIVDPDSFFLVFSQREREFFFQNEQNDEILHTLDLHRE
jgi:hypothetical protein